MSEQDKLGPWHWDDVTPAILHWPVAPVQVTVTRREPEEDSDATRQLGLKGARRHRQAYEDGMLGPDE